MEIKNIILHEVSKTKNKSDAQSCPREATNEINMHARFLSEQLGDLFRKTGLSKGKFSEQKNEDDRKQHFLTLLEKYFAGNKFTDFVMFTKAATEELARNMNEPSAASALGGYVWYNHYTHSNEHFLTVVLLRKKKALSVSDMLALEEIEEIDLDRLHMAARINLTTWREETGNRYISFKVGKGASDVTDYFSKFIGCEEYTAAKADTRNLVLATTDYCSFHSFDDEKSSRAKQNVFNQCLQWLDEGQPVTLISLSSILDETFQIEEEKKGEFLTIAQNDKYNLSNDISIERTALRGLIRYSGKNTKMAISFNQDLLNKTVIFNQNDQSLKFTELPANLIKQLSRDLTEETE